MDKLRIAKMPCSCLICRGRDKGESCKFTDLQDEEEIWVQEETKETTKRSNIEPAKEKALQEKNRKYVGLDTVTVANIKAYLRLRGEKLSGSKTELVEQALAVKDPGNDDSLVVVMPLAIHVLMPYNGDLGNDGNEEEVRT
jgi:hypothetical protein